MGWGSYGYGYDSPDAYNDLFGLGSMFDEKKKRFTLSDDPDETMQGALDKYGADQDLKKARKDKWMNVVSILPLIAQIFASKDSSSVSEALGNIQEVLEARRNALAKKVEADTQRQFEDKKLEKEYGFRSQEQKTQNIFAAGESEKDRANTREVSKQRQDFDKDMAVIDREFRSRQSELERAHNEKMTRLGIAANRENTQINITADTRRLLMADNYSIDTVDEIATALATKAGLKSLSAETQAAIKLNEELKKAKSLKERHDITLDTLAQLTKIEIPITTDPNDPLSPIAVDAFGKKMTRPLLSSEILAKFDTSYAASILSFDKKLPDDEIPTRGGAGTVAQDKETTAIKAGQDLFKDPELSKAVGKIKSSNNLAGAAQLGEIIYKATNGDSSMAFSAVDSLDLNEHMKEVARQIIKRLDDQKKQTQLFGTNVYNSEFMKPGG